MTGQRDALVIELGEPILDAIDTEARRLSVVEDRCVQGGHDAAYAKGEAEMRALTAGLGTLETAAGPIRVVPAARSRRKRGKATATTSSSGDAA
jgi:hypothetical protein